MTSGLHRRVGGVGIFCDKRPIQEGWKGWGYPVTNGLHRKGGRGGDIL